MCYFSGIKFILELQCKQGKLLKNPSFLKNFYKLSIVYIAGLKSFHKSKCNSEYWVQKCFLERLLLDTILLVNTMGKMKKHDSNERACHVHVCTDNPNSTKIMLIARN